MTKIGPRGAGGAGSPAGTGAGAGGLGPGVGSDTNPGSGITNPVRSMLRIRRDRRKIDIVQLYNTQGRTAEISSSRIPKCIVATTTCTYSGPYGNNHSFSGLVDILLVPLSFTNTCSDIYDHYNGAPSLRDHIILLDRITPQGAVTFIAATQVDIPEEIRNMVDYRLVVACAWLGLWGGGGWNSLSVSLVVDTRHGILITYSDHITFFVPVGHPCCRLEARAVI
ncbi:hypothetical protein BC827DRAFT_1201927 [Russula dissimulans]|nr:hypothetical protein BC827DRAFT_1201927 [Russula dissimulans]